MAEKKIDAQNNIDPATQEALRRANEVLVSPEGDDEEILVSAEMAEAHVDAEVVIPTADDYDDTVEVPVDENDKNLELFFDHDGDEQAEASKAPKEKEKGSFGSELIESVETFCYALVMMVVLFVFVFRFVTVQGESMRETLQHNDKLIISDMFYTPSTGDIVVVDTEGMATFQGHKYIIKRVIATGGQKVDINFKNWQVYVDGKLLDESYVRREDDISEMHGLNEGLFDSYGLTKTEQPDGSITFSFTVPDDMVFVMGDNRQHSSDGRGAGCMEEYRLLGRVLLRISPDFGGIE